jgi:LPXTG-site transpeptidase (sortase) family protein
MDEKNLIDNSWTLIENDNQTNTVELNNQSIPDKITDQVDFSTNKSTNSEFVHEDLPEIKPRPEYKLKNILIDILRAGAVFIFCFVFIYLFLTFPAYWQKGKYFVNKMLGKNKSVSLQIPATINESSDDLFLSTIKDAIDKSPDVIQNKYSINISDLENNYLIIPKLSIKAPIIWQVAPDGDLMLKKLQEGLVHYNGTGLPNETNGNVFISGHSSYYWWDKGKYKTVFANLDQLTKGDEMALAYKDKVYIYKVSDMVTVKPEQTEVLNPASSPILSLMTCVPVGTNLKRLIVKAERLQITTTSEQDKINDLKSINDAKNKVIDNTEAQNSTNNSTNNNSNNNIILENPIELLPWVN